MPDKDEIYRIWAPSDAPWSHWVKPVLFSFTDAGFQAPPGRSVRLETNWIPAPGSTALLLDLPEDDGVLCSLLLARIGYRPVPLYNALPFPPYDKMTAPNSRPASTVHVEPILAALVGEASALQQISLLPDAPPVFLLDAARRVARTELRPGVFDNRSVCFITDFPSAQFLLNHGIRSVIVVQETSEFARDLVETLLSWQNGGIQILRKKRGDTEMPVAVVVKLPSFLNSAWFRLTTALGLRKGELGGYGGIVPPSSG